MPMNRWREYAEAVPLPVWLASGLALLALVVGVLLPESELPAPSVSEPELLANIPPPKPPATPEPLRQAPTRIQQESDVASLLSRSTPPKRPPATLNQPKPIERFELPTLNKSDKLVRGQLATLMGLGPVRRWLTTDQLLRRFVAIATNASAAKVLSRQFSFTEIGDPFTVIERGGRIYIDPASYHRYDPIVKIVMSIDSKAMAVLLRRLSPLLEQAYRELGYPQGNISQVLRGSLQQVINAPVIERDIRLVRPSVMYRFADPALERQSLLNRQLFRMGADNTRQLQAKAKELLAVL